MAIMDLLTLVGGLWLAASVTGMGALAALYAAERTRAGRQAPGASAEPPPLHAASTDWQSGDQGGGRSVVRR